MYIYQSNYSITELDSFLFHQQEQDKVEKEFYILFQELEANGASYREKTSAVELINRGKEIASLLISGEDNLPVSKKHALALTWFLMACAFQEGNAAYVRGVVRIPFGHEASIKFKHYLSLCGAHNRPASHFSEMKVGNNKGIDFEKGTLPLDNDLSTMLFNRLNDGSFYIKLEREPLSFTKPIHSIKHMINWKKHVTSHGGAQTVHGMPSRRETDGQDEVKKAFSQVILELRKVEKSQKVNPKKEIKKNDRIFKMSKRVAEIEKNIFLKTDGFHLSSLKEAIENFKNVISLIPHSSTISGNEVIVNLRPWLLPRS